MSKEEQPQKEQEENVSTKTSFKVILATGALLVKVFIIAIVAGGAYFLYQNPQILQKSFFEKKGGENPANEALIVQINQLQNQVASLQSQILEIHVPDISVFEDKVESLKKMNMNVIDSKADAAIVLGMLTRVDKLENRLDKLAKISDDGALILSAAMLVKQAAEEGGSFIYEAEILNQLTPAESSINKDVSVVSEYARNGVISKNILQRRFLEVYGSFQQKEDLVQKNWKERLNDKINEYVKISKTGSRSQVVEKKNELDDIADVIAEGQVKKAVKLIESSENDDIKQNQNLQAWLVDAKNLLSFNQAIRNIAAYSLAEMKVKNLKNKE